ncbi:hypothetical protein Tco_0371668 [Tanacetum coccineum]
MLIGPTYDLIKGTCKSVVELEYHLEEVFKAINDQLDWHNPKGRPYPHDLRKPLPLITDARGRLIIPYDHFINNDLKYLKGGSSSSIYITSITKIKAANYSHVKWIKDKIPRSTWSEVQVVYDKHAYWGIYHWVPKRQRFYGYATNLETSKDVYSKHRIIAVTKGNFKRLRHEDIEDMLLLLVQGIIYQDDIDKNCLMRTDELYKFSDGTLNHVRTSLNDIATGIQMEYFPKRKWTKQDKQRARVMIKAIDKKLKYMRSNLNIRVISFTMKMEILLESTSNKLMVGQSSRIRRKLKDGVKYWFLLTHRFIATCYTRPDKHQGIMNAKSLFQRPRKYSELTLVDVKATNIILQGLSQEVYALVSNHKVAKELWERIQLLMKGTSLTKQERECKLYDEFDKFAYKKGETLRDFYLRFSLLLNDMNIYKVKLE